MMLVGLWLSGAVCHLMWILSRNWDGLIVQMLKATEDSTPTQMVAYVWGMTLSLCAVSLFFPVHLALSAWQWVESRR